MPALRELERGEEVSEDLATKLNKFRPLERGILTKFRLYSQWRDAYMTTSPYGLPLKIDLPGVNAPDWIEEEGDDNDE